MTICDGCGCEVSAADQFNHWLGCGGTNAPRGSYRRGWRGDYAEDVHKSKVAIAIAIRNREKEKERK